MKIFLDDERNPTDVLDYTNFNRNFYQDDDIVVVKNFTEFEAVVNEFFDKITAISFDHDLGDKHYVDEKYWDDYEASKNIQNVTFSKERTGVDCARMFIDKYLTETNHSPFQNILINIHTANPVGADNIDSIFKSYIKLFGGDLNSIEVYKKDM